MTVGVYGIFNAETDECLYVGLSKNIELSKTFHHLKDPKYCSRKCVIESESKSFNKQELTDKYNSGLSLHDLAKEYNCSYRTIHAFMVRYNIPRRTSAEIYNSLDEAEKQERISKLRTKIKNLEKTLCSLCNKSFSPLSIKKHQTACTNKPKCVDCQVPVVKKFAKRCAKCYKAFQAAQKRLNINKCIDCGSTISKSSAKRCVSCYKQSLVKA